MKLKLFTAATLAAAALTFTLPTGTHVGAQTGGKVVPCPGSPYNNGWFDTANNGIAGAVNCTQQNNHIVVDVYNSRGVRSAGVVDAWYGAECDLVSFVEPQPGSPFQIRFRNNTWQSDPSGAGCGFGGVDIAAPGAEWWSAVPVTVTIPTKVALCEVRSPVGCGATEGWVTARPHGLGGWWGTGAPFTPVVFVGHSPTGQPGTFTTTVSVYVTS